jgi:hypothetical protein
MKDDAIWPDLGVARWAASKKQFHLYLQMLGKLRVKLSPTEPNWMFTALYLGAHGITTGPMPWREGSVQASLDVFASQLSIEMSDGRAQRIALLPARTVAEIWDDLHAALTALGVAVTLLPIPQEVPDLTPMNEDRRPGAYDPTPVQRWFHAATATATVFAEWRDHFFGRSGIQLWWGACDIALLLFNGKHAQPPMDRGYLLRYDLDAEMMNAGLYPGDDANAPFFYGYIYPEPAGAAQLAIAPAAAAWSSTLREWVLPYEAVRMSEDPAAMLRTFLDSIYESCISAAGWDRAALSYDPPKRHQQR